MANAVEAKGQCWLWVGNGLLDGKDRWSRSTGTPPDKWPSRRASALVNLDSLFLALRVSHTKEKQEHHFEARGHKLSEDVCLSE